MRGATFCARVASRVAPVPQDAVEQDEEPSAKKQKTSSPAKKLEVQPAKKWPTVNAPTCGLKGPTHPI